MPIGTDQWGQTSEFKHDQMASNQNTDAPAPPDIAVSMYYSKTFDNICCFHDPAYDALFEEFRATTSMDEAKRLLVELDRYGIEQHPALKLFPIHDYNVWQPYLKGYSGELMVRSAGMWPLARSWIDENLK